jgi:hypothetical protein
MVASWSIGRAVLRILVGALCVAAAVACLALLRGEFSDTDWKVIATSTLFALVSSMAAAGAAVRERSRVLAAVTVGATLLGFALVSIGMWGDIDGEGFWRATGCVAIVALESAHAAFVLSRLRSSDPPVVASVTRGAVGLAVVSGQLLCTALAPLLRRLHAGAERPAVEVPRTGESLELELIAVADRLERLGAGPQVHAECEHLRRLARIAIGGSGRA